MDRMDTDDARTQLDRAAARLRAIHDQRVAQYRSRQHSAGESALSASEEGQHGVSVGEPVDRRLGDLGQRIARLEPTGAARPCDVCDAISVTL